MKRKRVFTWHICVVILLVIVSHGIGLHNDFVWDDEYVVVDNPPIRQIVPLERFFTDASTSANSPALNHYRPLRTLGLALQYEFWGLNAVGYHATNITLHALVCVLLLLLLGNLGLGRGSAIFLTTLFATHPITTEVVSGIVGQADLLAAVFVLLTLLLHRWANTRHRILVLPGVLMTLTLALLSKESAIVLGPLLLLESMLLRGSLRIGTQRLMITAAYWSTIITISIGYLWLTLGMLFSATTESYPAITFMRTQLMQAKVLVKYLQLILAPVGLSIRHDVNVPLSYYEGESWLALTVVSALVFWILWLWQRGERLAAFGGAWFFVSLLPVMNLIPLPGAVMGERFLYLPLMGALILVGALVEKWRKNWGSSTERKVVIGVAILVIVFSGLSIARTSEWKDNITLFESAVKVAPRSNAIRINLMREYKKRGDLDLYQKHLKAGIENDHWYAEYYGRVAESAEQESGPVEALEWYRKALIYKPKSPELLAAVERLSHEQDTK